MAKACEECTMHCLMMHKKNKNPASLVTTFVKVMISDDYSKTLFLPPNFACRVKKMVGKTTRLEDSSGEKWDVTFTMVGDRLAFKDGWNTFALKHGLQKGDILVFHYVMKSHFVVLMYGSTGCPELRHFGFKETKKNNDKVTMNGQNGQSLSKVHTNCNNMSHECSSKSEPDVHGVNDMNGMNTMHQKLKDDMVSPNEKTTNTQHLVDKETDKKSEPLVNNGFLDCMLTESPTTMEPLCLIDNHNGHEQDKCVVESDGGEKNNVAASGVGSDETETNRIQNLVESGGGLKNNVAASDGGGGSDETENNRIQKSVGPVGGQKNDVAASGGGGSDETEKNRIQKSVGPAGGQKNDVAASGGRQKNNVAASGGGGLKETEDRIFRKSLDARVNMKIEKRRENKVIQSEAAQSNSNHKRLRPANVPSPPAKTVKKEPNSGYPTTSTGISPNPMATRMETIKKEPTMNQGSGGLPTMNHGSDGLLKREPKPEPVEYDEAPLSGSSNPSFSATMSSYQYLELPSWVKLKSKTILLRNGSDLWPVLYQSKYGLKALTKSWSIFAHERGINPGDKCEFVLENEPSGHYACSVFNVHVTR